MMYSDRCWHNEQAWELITVIPVNPHNQVIRNLSIDASLTRQDGILIRMREVVRIIRLLGKYTFF